jgi:hypothetical protein
MHADAEAKILPQSLKENTAVERRSTCVEKLSRILNREEIRRDRFIATVSYTLDLLRLRSNNLFQPVTNVLQCHLM